MAPATGQTESTGGRTMNAPLRTALLALLVSAAGCATIHPVAPSWTAKEIRESAEPDPFIGSNATDARKLVQGTRQLLSDAAHHRRIADITASEVTFYGTLIGVLGLSLDKAGLMNTGGGAATLGTLFSGRYKLADQEVVFRKAEARAACLELALAEMAWGKDQLGFAGNPSVAAAQSLTTLHGNNASAFLLEAHTATADVPRLVALNLRRLTNDLRIALADIPLTAMTRDQMIAALEGPAQAEDKAKKDAVAAFGSANSEQGAQFLAALVATVALEKKFDACFVENPQ